LIVLVITVLGFCQINWEYEIADSVEKSKGGIVFVSLQLDTLLSPKFVYYYVKLDTNHSDTLKLMYTFKNGNHWVKETVDSSIGNYFTSYYQHPSLCLDRYDNPHIAYIYRMQDSCYLRYANKSNSVWSTQDLDIILNPSNLAIVSLDIDTNDYPCIAYAQYQQIGAFWYIKYLHYNGTSWHSSVINDGNNLSDQGPSLAIDQKNHPHIAYYQACDPLSDSVKYVYWDGTNWVFAWAESICMRSEQNSLSLTLDTFNHPHIGYCKWPALYYSFYDGSSWHTEGPIAGASCQIRLDLDSLNLPHVVYVDQMIFHPTYSYRDSVMWNLCGWVEPDTHVYTFRSVSFCLDDNSEPHVAYVGISSDYDKMKYAKGTFVGIEEVKNTIVSRYDIGVFPNPSQEFIHIEYILPKKTDVNISIFDVAGRKVGGITNENQAPGIYRKSFDVGNIPQGVYFIKLNTDDKSVVKKAIFLR